jgi:hypothetical protein
MGKLFLLFILFVITKPVVCQSPAQDFLKQVITENYIGQQPLTLDLTLEDTALYQENLFERWGKKVPPEALVNLIERSKITDTTLWRESELPAAFFFTLDRKMPPVEYFYNKIKPHSQNDTVKLLNIIERYKVTLNKGGEYFYSRPVFDESHSYAVIAYNNGYGLSGRGGIQIYNWDGEKWQQLGSIKNGVH